LKKKFQRSIEFFFVRAGSGIFCKNLARFDQDPFKIKLKELLNMVNIRRVPRIRAPFPAQRGTIFFSANVRPNRNRAFPPGQ